MSKTVQIASPGQFNDLLKSSAVVVADCEFATGSLQGELKRFLERSCLLICIVYADWCGPCKQTAPVYEQLSAKLSKANHITFVKVNTDTQKEVASRYNVASLPTFMVFKKGEPVRDSLCLFSYWQNVLLKGHC
jgi:thioredoxin